MLVLFNTGYRIGYIDNVFRTLFFPKGFENEYRYSVGDGAQVQKTDIAQLRKQIDNSALICFGDRFGRIGEDDAYVFYPIRLGRIVDVEERGSKVFIRVELGDFVAASSPTKFTESLRRFAEQERFGLLRRGKDAKDTNDGKYAYPTTHEDGIRSAIETGEECWWTAVKQLAETAAFKTEIGARPLFSRAVFQ